MAFRNKSEKKTQAKRTLGNLARDTFVFCRSDSMRNIFKSSCIEGKFLKNQHVGYKNTVPFSRLSANCKKIALWWKAPRNGQKFRALPPISNVTWTVTQLLLFAALFFLQPERHRNENRKEAGWGILQSQKLAPAWNPQFFQLLSTFYPGRNQIILKVNKGGFFFFFFLDI